MSIQTADTLLEHVAETIELPESGYETAKRRYEDHQTGWTFQFIVYIRNGTTSVRVALRCPAPSPRYRSPLLVVNA